MKELVSIGLLYGRESLTTHARLAEKRIATNTRNSECMGKELRPYTLFGLENVFDDEARACTRLAQA